MSNEVALRTGTDLMLNAEAMQSLYKVAELMAASHITVPKHLQSSPGDCMAIAMQSAQWGMNPFAVAQKTHLVNGNLGYEAQLVNAVVSSSKAVRGRFHYEYKDWNNDNGFVRVGAVLAGETEITWGEWMNTATVKTKNSPLWKTAPKQQAAYLAVKMWARLYCPEVILGVYTADEFEDTAPVTQTEKDITPAQPQQTAEALFAQLDAKPEPAKETQQEAAQETQEAVEDKIATYVDVMANKYNEAPEEDQIDIWDAVRAKLVNHPDWLATFQELTGAN